MWSLQDASGGVSEVACTERDISEIFDFVLSPAARQKRPRQNEPP